MNYPKLLQSKNMFYRHFVFVYNAKIEYLVKEFDLEAILDLVGHEFDLLKENIFF